MDGDDATQACMTKREGTSAAMRRLTDDVRTEMDKILHTAENDNRHAMAFRGLNQGLSTKQMAQQWNKSQSYVSMVVRSLRLMLDGEIPDAPSIALTNSFGYRELLDYRPSAELRTYVYACLTALRERNPRVRLEPMGNSPHADRTLTPDLRRPASYCGRCYLMQPCECD